MMTITSKGEKKASVPRDEDDLTESQGWNKLQILSSPTQKWDWQGSPV